MEASELEAATNTTGSLPTKVDPSVIGGKELHFAANSPYSDPDLSGQIALFFNTMSLWGFSKESGLATTLFTDVRKTEMYQFFVVAFSAAPGTIYFAQLRDAVQAGLSTREIVNIFTTKQQFTSVYSQLLSSTEFATSLVNNVIKSSASDSAKANAISDIVEALAFGLSRGDVIFNVFGNLAAISDPANPYAEVTRQFDKQITVSRYFTETLLGSSQDVATLHNVIKNVTNASDVSSVSLIEGLITSGTGTLPPAAFFAAPQSSLESVNEGQSITFSIQTSNVPSGTVLAYQLNGSAGLEDIDNNARTGNVLVGENGLASIVFPITLDQLTEGTETLVFSYTNPFTLVSAGNVTVAINDTSVAPTSAYTVSAD